MAIFSYRATTREGTVVEGAIEAADEKTAVEMLRNTGVIPLSVEAPKEGMRKRISFRSAKGDILTFTTELTALLGAGLPLDRSLNIIAEVSESKEMKGIVQSILKSIREGSSFSDALQKHPKVFPRIYVNMVRAGEAGGVLDIVLEKLNEFLESSKELKDHIISSMIYPVILIVAGGISIIFMFTFVLPRFSTIFSEVGSALPLSTKIILLVQFGTEVLLVANRLSRCRCCYSVHEIYQDDRRQVKMGCPEVEAYAGCGHQDRDGTLLQDPRHFA